MGHVLAFTMQKGGVAKSTSVLNIGATLGKRGARVLLIDLDPQANLTEGLGIDTSELENSVYEVLINPEQGIHQETVTPDASVDLVPATLDLAGAELELAGTIGRELLLRDALGEARRQYDYILIDPPPNLGFFTVNAMVAADAVIVPIQPEVNAYRGMPRLEKTINVVRKLNPGLKIGGILLTRFDRRKNLHHMIGARLREDYGDLVFQTIIPENSKIAESPAAGTPVSAYAPGSPGDVAYAAVADELEARYGYK